MLVFCAQALISEVDEALMEWNILGRIPAAYDTDPSVRWRMERDIEARRQAEDAEFAAENSVGVDVADAEEEEEGSAAQCRRVVVEPEKPKHEYIWQYRADHKPDGVLNVEQSLREALRETLPWIFFHFRKSHHETYLFTDTAENRELLLNWLVKCATWDKQWVKAATPEMLKATIEELAAMMPETTEAPSYEVGSRVQVLKKGTFHPGEVAKVNKLQTKSTYDVKLDGYDTPQAGKSEKVEYDALRPPGIYLKVAHPSSLDCLCVDTKPEYVTGNWAPKNAADTVWTRADTLATIGTGFAAVAALGTQVASASAAAALTADNFWLKMGLGIGASASVVALTIALWALAASLRSVKGTQVDPIVALNLALGYWLPSNHEAKKIAVGNTAPDMTGSLAKTAPLVLKYTLGDHERLRGVVEGDSEYMQIFHDYCIDGKCETGRLTNPLLKFFGGVTDEVYVNAYKTCMMTFVKSHQSLKDPANRDPYLQLVRLEWSATKNATVKEGGHGLMHSHIGSGCVFRGSMLLDPIPFTTDSPLRWTLDHKTGTPLVKGRIGMDFLPFQAANAQDGRSRSGRGSFSASQWTRLSEEQEHLITTPPGIPVDATAEAALREMFGDEYFKKNDFKKNTMPTHVLYKLTGGQARTNGTGNHGVEYRMLLKRARTFLPTRLYMASPATMRERHAILRD